jgi:uncharacterized RDD family membrane protein YckC
MCGMKRPMNEGAVPAPPVSSQAVGFWPRTRAYLIDAILLALVGGAPLLLTSAQTEAQQQAASSGSGLISLLYFVFFWSHFGGGRTIGMRVYGLRVIQEDGRPLGLWTALVRYIGLAESFALCFIGVLWVERDPRHQGWHDKLAHTLVVPVERKAAALPGNAPTV